MIWGYPYFRKHPNVYYFKLGHCKDHFLFSDSGFRVKPFSWGAAVCRRVCVGAANKCVRVGEWFEAFNGINSERVYVYMHCIVNILCICIFCFFFQEIHVFCG